MLKSLIEIFRSIFRNPVLQNDLEAYIIAGHPQDSGDVDRLEKEFLQQRKYLSGHWD
jgi:hypothetical protein